MKLRFSLQTLLLIVTVAAIAFWAYWFGWPRWQMYREQVRFEESVQNLKAGMTEDEASRLVRWPKKVRTSTVAYDSQRRPIILTKYDWPNAIYCVYYVYPRGNGKGPHGESCISVEVFRLPPVPRRYEAQTKSGRDSVSRRIPPIKPADIPEAGYMSDFLAIISGDRKNNYGIEYELIYSDNLPQETLRQEAPEHEHK
jgi:hypothetical protein